ncbi:hypothetical protein K474DRAFT_1677992 [Panus rudis PR-1116 ss-1]|nr:hypothetical protein K474DRAFT_1677992 [Panus rudis PR-1116 ss-1]
MSMCARNAEKHPGEPDKPRLCASPAEAKVKRDAAEAQKVATVHKCQQVVEALAAKEDEPHRIEKERIASARASCTPRAQQTVVSRDMVTDSNNQSNSLLQQAHRQPSKRALQGAAATKPSPAAQTTKKQQPAVEPDITVDEGLEENMEIDAIDVEEEGSAENNIDEDEEYGAKYTEDADTQEYIEIDDGENIEEMDVDVPSEGIDKSMVAEDIDGTEEVEVVELEVKDIDASINQTTTKNLGSSKKVKKKPAGLRLNWKKFVPTHGHKASDINVGVYTIVMDSPDKLSNVRAQHQQKCTPVISG